MWNIVKLQQYSTKSNVECSFMYNINIFVVSEYKTLFKN